MRRAMKIQVCLSAAAALLAGCNGAYVAGDFNHAASVEQAELARTEAQAKAAHCAGASIEARRAHGCQE
jgi:predicted small secreted protein